MSDQGTAEGKPTALTEGEVDLAPNVKLRQNRMNQILREEQERQQAEGVAGVFPPPAYPEKAAEARSPVPGREGDSVMKVTKSADIRSRQDVAGETEQPTRRRQQKDQSEG